MINRAVTMRQYPDDYPHVRASSYCVGCEGPKEAGLVLCWPCWRALKHASQVEQAAVDNKLDLQEVRLAAHFALQARFAPIESREWRNMERSFNMRDYRPDQATILRSRR